MTSRYIPEKKTIGTLLSMTNPPIVVPDWQRNYSWTEAEVKSFWDDLVRFDARYPAENIASEEYFLGSVVIVDATTAHLVLDGQQRLATSAILLSVIRDFLGRYSADAATRLSSRYLTDFDDALNRTTYKLTLNTYDRDFFQRDILEKRDAAYTPAVPVRASHKLIRAAREYFSARFEEKFHSLGNGEPAHQWALRIQRVLTSGMSVVAVVTDDEDNAATVFETLNERGIGLSTPDLLRNLLLRRARPDTREEIIDAWGEILELGADPMLRSFLRHYWLSYEGDVKAQSLYREIKDAIETDNKDSLMFTRSLQRASSVYRDMVNGADDDNAFRETLNDINEVGGKMLYPALLSAHDVGTLEQRRLLARALLIAYVRHNVVGRLEGAQLERVVFAIAQDVRGTRDFAESARRLAEVSPDDAAFELAFTQVQLPNVSARYLLVELEKKMRATEELEVAPPSRVHVEHIYPQTPLAGEKWLNHSAFVQRLGNLTLLSRRLNTTIQNASFPTKRLAYEESELLLTKDLTSQTAWTSADVDARQRRLAGLATSIWTFPTA